MSKPIYVTQPSLPDLDRFKEELENIWESKWLTNNGKYHEQFEHALKEFLDVENVSLFTNGTIALIIALKALRITGEVITTPYSFVATTHALHWNGIKPVFCDIRREDFNIDTEKIEALITPATTAIMPVHVYGNPCNHSRIQEIADIYGLKVIYDAAHAFGVEFQNNSILNWGDLSVLSFHATKTFNTIEGGAIITKSSALKKRLDYFKNFGFAGETRVIGYGINGKMNELISAYGILQLDNIETDIKKRKYIANWYRNALKNIPGLSIYYDFPEVTHNYTYFPILIDPSVFPLTRDELYARFKHHNIYTRRYFYPLISQFPAYKELASASKENLPIATQLTKQVLCLPIHASLSEQDLQRIVEVIKTI